ncbi:MAG: hypothetical protein J6T10_16575 [Methanobrevibacter sp.]|nr:hypothetical protein [Methanobrevibacter sp.]
MPSPYITKVYLLNVPLESDLKNTLYFANASAQQSYFQSVIQKSYTDFSYQRKDHFIRVPAQYDTLANCNYVMYQNSAYSNKWFYAFITRMEYVDDGRTDIYIETDVMQTYMFDITVKSSFVEREHVNNDTVGLHTVPENVETGEYVCNSVDRDNELNELAVVLRVTMQVPTGEGEPIHEYATSYGGIWEAGGAYIFDNTTSGLTMMVNVIKAYDDNGYGDAITAVYAVPKKVINDTSPQEAHYSGQLSPVTYTHTTTKPSSLNGYTPVNNKLLTFPYCYILNSNNNGSSNVLQYENFSTNDCQFEISGVPTIGASIKCSPKNYKNAEVNQEEGLMCGKFPTMSWSQDLYTNWLTQNAVNIGVGIASNALGIIGGAGLLGAGGGMAGAGMITSGALGIASSIGQIYEHSLQPPVAKGNTNGGDINTCNSKNKFYFYHMTIKAEYAQIIDNYFSMFGYKVNRVKVPNKAHRARWWYTKCIDVNIDGPVPNDDMQKIKNAYNDGITFWRNASEIQNYSLSNNIV